MRLITNEKLIKRNATLGKYTVIGGLAILVGGLIVSFSKQNDPDWQLVPFYTLLVGFLLSNVGTYYFNRYVREPRADQALEAALKGSDDRYYFYNYRLPASHVLVCPAGIYVLVPKFQAGKVEWDGKRWKHHGASLFRSIFGQEGLGNPNSEVASEIATLSKFLAKKVGGELTPVQGIIVFYSPQAQVEAKNAPIPAMHVKQLKEYLRKLPKGPSLNNQQITKLNEAIGA